MVFIALACLGRQDSRASPNRGLAAKSLSQISIEWGPKKDKKLSELGDEDD